MQLKNLTTSWDLQIIEQKESYQHNFSSEVIEAIEESFASIFTLPHSSIFHYLEKEHGITKQNFNKNIERFVDIIEESFGPAAKLFEIKIVELVHKKIKKFNHTPKKHDLFFREYIVDLFSFS